ncbi:hypothetical protein J2045_003343 [Peteryoungia aggregata LMG 23059]|uniref:Uncharacterized protein n=1 Tax=Peteryoungia aggregata LMG 23059 TaxID=1368425 RepID=A0ABU0GAC0_9HYPH|nr:hypothetical protein [Peteryoungia aggregata]MDQ0422295.1 hypothetical protein [Peteryoungia aggregata LMG 23059]
MAIFDRLDRMLSRTVDRTNAISFELTPYVSTPNGRPMPDPNRQVIRGKGIFDYFSTEFGIQLGVRKSYREANDLRSLHAGRDPQLSVDRIYFPIGVQEPKQGDIVSFPDRPELPEFDVTSAQRDGMSRLVLMLAQRGAQG